MKVTGTIPEAGRPDPGDPTFVVEAGGTGGLLGAGSLGLPSAEEPWGGIDYSMIWIGRDIAQELHLASNFECRLLSRPDAA